MLRVDVFSVIAILRQLIITAVNFRFHLDRFANHEIRRENPFSHSILACFVALRRAGYSMGTHHASILSDVRASQK